MRRFALLLCLFAPVLAQGDSENVATAKQFLGAFRAKDSARQTLAAAKPASRVDYCLAIDWLLFSGELKAADALAKLRGGNGPEGAGLSRIVESFRNGLFPRPAQIRSLQQAAMALRANDTAAALQLLEGAGEPMEGTTFGVRVSWALARTFGRAGHREDALRELERCARLARSVGWLKMARAADKERMDLADDPADALDAAEAYVKATHALGDERALLGALRKRGAYRVRVARLTKDAKEAERLRQGARQDYRRVIDLAEQQKRPFDAAQAWRDLALIVEVHDGQPKQAIELYQNAIGILRDLPRPRELDDAIIGAARAMTAVGRYEDALVLLGEVLRRGGQLMPRALARRAYILSRQGRVERAIKAWDRALAATKDRRELAQLHVEAGALQVQRGDLRAAEAHYRAALGILPTHPQALAGLATVKGRRGNEAGALALFDDALQAEKNPVARARMLLAKMALQRIWGRIEDALRTTEKANHILVDRDLGEYANAAVTWAVLADLTLLRQQKEKDRYEKAQFYLARGGTIFFKLQDPSHAIDLYAQETLVLVMLGKMEEALKRLKTLLLMADTTPDQRLKSAAKATEAIFEARAGRLAEADQALDEAVRLAQEAKDPLREATALVNRALIRPETAVRNVGRALALLDGRRLEGPEERPLIEGHRPDYACSIALAALLAEEKKRPDVAYRFLERTLQERLLIALRGREAYLEATLPKKVHEEYIATCGRLAEARVEQKGIDAAVKAYDQLVARLTAQEPWIASVAWPRPPALKDVRAALRKDEALLLFLADSYAQALLYVDRDRIDLLEVDFSKPLDLVAEHLAKRKKLIVAGPFTRTPLENYPFKEATVGTAFEVYYVSSAAGFLRQRKRRLPRGRGLWALGDAPARFGKPQKVLPGGRQACLHVGLPAKLDGFHPQTSRIEDENALVLLGRRHLADLVVVTDTETRAGPRGEGIGALVEALLHGGTRGVVLSTLGPPPAREMDALYAALLDRKAPPGAAVRETRLAMKPQAKRPEEWAGLVHWGVPE